MTDPSPDFEEFLDKIKSLFIKAASKTACPKCGKPMNTPGHSFTGVIVPVPRPDPKRWQNN